MKGRFFNYIIIGAILSIMVWLGIEEYKDRKIKREETSYQTENLSVVYNSHTEEKQQQQQEETNIKEEIINQYKGYPVAAKLEIPEIGLETYILEKYSTHALNVSVTKFWGAEPNQIGNFCVAGHNFQNKNMFRNLKKLGVGNRLFITDNKMGKIEYEIYDVYKVEPEDVSCLSQETNGKREVTLITCTNNSELRIIVKARG